MATSSTSSTIPSSSSSSPTSPLLVEGGNKALSKRHHQRKNGLSSSSSSSSLKSSAAGTGLNKTPSIVLSSLTGSRGRAVAASSCRMLFGPVDHDEVLEWLTERQDDRRRQLADKYGFDLVLAEEGVYSVGPLQQQQPATSSC